MTYLHLDDWNLALAAGLVLINAGLSLVLQLGLARRLLVAAARMTVQLLLVGLVLRTLFATQSPWWTGAVTLAMLGFAAWEIGHRLDRPLLGGWSYGLSGVSITLAATLAMAFAFGTQLRPDPWYDPRYVVPLLGMILGNAMTGIALGLNTLTRAVVERRNAVEARLALGDDRRTALLGPVRQAARTAMIPTINSMAATGLVFLPGMMTGQILAGTAPSDAVRYQLLVMFLIAGSTGLGAVAAILLGAARLTDARHRLRLDRLSVGEA